MWHVGGVKSSFGITTVQGSDNVSKEPNKSNALADKTESS